MGFWDLNAFNLAMLAKHAWRLIQNTHSLFHKVYKARYFPRNSFLKAELGPNPSFVWRSLLAARVIIMEGSRWQVGDGRTIEVATHVWLPHAPIFLQEPTLNMRVCELIDEDTRQWDRGKVLATFTQKTWGDIGDAVEQCKLKGHAGVEGERSQEIHSANRVPYRCPLEKPQLRGALLGSMPRTNLGEDLEAQRASKGTNLFMEGLL